MNHVQLTRATLLAAALVAAAPSPAQAQDRRHPQLLKLLLLLKGAPQMRAAAERAAKTHTARTPVRPTRPAVSPPPGPALLAARSDSSGTSLPALPVAGDPALLAR